MMIIGIHQPNFLPWLGYFYKIIRSDNFVLLDNVQYTKNSFINRNRIKTPQGEAWLTVPVRIKGKFGQCINEVEIDNTGNWRKKQLGSLEANYRKSTFFDQIYDGIRSIYCHRDYENLCEFNIGLLEWLLSILHIQNKFVRASTLGMDGKSTSLLINIVRRMGSNVYVSGFGGAKYQEEERFKEAGISLKYYEFHHPAYSQPWGAFVPNLSVLDLIFNHGPESRQIIMGAGTEVPQANQPDYCHV